MEAAQLFLHALDPLDPSEPGVFLDALLALADEDGVPRERPGDPIRRRAAQLLAAVWKSAVEWLEGKARSDLEHAVRVVEQLARALRELPDPRDPAAQELHELLGWALTAVRNHASDVRQLAGARARARQSRGIVRDHPWPRPRLALAVRPRQRSDGSGPAATTPSPRPDRPSAPHPSATSGPGPSDQADCGPSDQADQGPDDPAGRGYSERRWPPPYRPADADGASTRSMGSAGGRPRPATDPIDCRPPLGPGRTFTRGRRAGPPRRPGVRPAPPRRGRRGGLGRRR
jgi:hypothetical protein